MCSTIRSDADSGVQPINGPIVTGSLPRQAGCLLLMYSQNALAGSFRGAPIVAALSTLIMLACPCTGAAQTIQTYFPSGNYGYDQQLGVTVLTRSRPLYASPGVRVGGFVVNPGLDESLFYNSNLNGNPGSGTWGARTAGSISANSDWSRDKIAASASFSNYQLLSFPGDDYTDWNAGLGGGYTIGDSMVEAAYSHQVYHQIGTVIGTVSSATPVSNQTDTAHLDYTFNLGRIALTPDISASAYRFGSATIQGVPSTQQFLNRNVLAGGIGGRYLMSDGGGILTVLRATTSDFIAPQQGQPSNDSRSIMLLGGIDYQAKGLWRYRFLAGIEMRTFQASQYSTHFAPIAEGGVIWTPTDLVTVTSTLSRAVEDPEIGGTNGFVSNLAHLVVDYEYRRNIFLQARGSIQYAQYLQSGGGSQTGLTTGGNATWLLNRNVRLSLDYNFTRVTGSINSVSQLNPGTALTTAPPYTQSVIALTLHFAL